MELSRSTKMAARAILVRHIYIWSTIEFDEVHSLVPPFHLWTFMCDLSPKLEAQIRLQTGQATVVSEEAAEGLSFTAARLSSLVFRLVCSDSLTFLLMVVLHFALSAACFSHVS